MKKRTFGKARAWRKGGVYVLKLQGSASEMAGQHGALLREEIRNGALPFLGKKNAKLIGQSPLFRNNPTLFKLALGLIRLTIQKPMLAQVPRKYIEEARALAKGAGIPYQYCEQSMLQADTLVLLLRVFLGRHFLGQLGAGLPGCTSVVAVGDASKEGGVVHARNMDYPVVGKWDPYPTVFYCDPEGIDKGQRYIGISSAGIHTPGITGINESGITLSTHFHCARSVSPFGTPIQFIGAEVLTRAKTIGQAIDIAQDFNRAGSWSFVVSSPKENTAALIEMTHGKVSVVEPDAGKLAHSNHFQTRELKESEVLLSTGISTDCILRYCRAMELLREHSGKVDRFTAARILADGYDQETKRLRGHGNTISVVTTITSMISEPNKGRFWVANSGESPTCLGDYTGFQIDETFENFDAHEAELLNWSPEGATTIRGTKKHDAFRKFREAYMAFHTEFNVETAADAAEQAALADAEEGHYHLAHGHFRMRLGQFERALEAFHAADSCVLSRHLNHVTQVFCGHALDCLGRREEAITYYKKAEHTFDPHLRKEARRCLRRPYKADRAENITFDLQFCDSLEYA